eukprot:TRINITY_DN1335_c0_g1_i1.p1 TRINITY_DN1335_c0_g1~~TRINITY_DN1335_c0_g1_i1.p1  ORF type:complete len:176 (-),score=39.13 TRINITY_DN1335_c0_g1_i1:131-658(-)
MAYHEYQVVGRRKPSETEPNPKVFRMRIFAQNPIVAKSRFYYFIKLMKNVKRANGEILAVNEIFEKRPEQIKNFGIFLRYNSHTGTHNIYREFRDLTRVGAIAQLYQDMAGRYRARFGAIQIISIDAIPASKTRRANIKQFHNSKIKFPLPHRSMRVASRKFKTNFQAVRPQTFH